MLNLGTLSNPTVPDNTIEPRLPPADLPQIRQPVWRRPGVLNLLVIALFAELGLAVLNISTMPPYLKNARHMGEGTVALVLTAFLLSEAVFKSPMGHLADHFGRKTLMTIAPLLTVGTSLLTLVIPRGWGVLEILMIVALRVVDGLGAAMFWPAAYAASGECVPDKERQQAMSLLNACYFVGIAFALPIGGAMEDLVGYDASLIMAAAVFFLVAIAVNRLMPHDTPHHHEETAEGEFNLLRFIHTAREIPQYLLLATVTFCGIGFPAAIIKIFAQEQFRMTASEFGSFIVLPGALAMVVLSVPMAHLGERLGRTKAVHIGMGMCAAGLIFIALGAVVPWLRSPWAMAAGGIPVGVGFLLAIPAWMASVSDLNPRKRAANLGAVMTAQGLGAIVGVPVGGQLYERLTAVDLNFGHYSPFIGCALFVTAGWLVSLRILKSV